MRIGAAAALGSPAGAVAPERTACQAAKTARSSSGRASARWASAGLPSRQAREELGALGGGGARRLGVDRGGDRRGSAKRPWAEKGLGERDAGVGVGRLGLEHGAQLASASATAPAS